MTVYKPVWQTWNLVRPQPRAMAAPTPAVDVPACTRLDLRQRVQRARIERRWSVADLSEHATCDTETLAAFERGDEILAPEVQLRVRRVLGL